YVADQNNRAEAEIPELRAGGETAAAFKRAAVETMHSLGYDDAAIMRACEAGQVGLREQKLIAAATRERLAEQTRASLNQKKTRPVPPVAMRPGVAGVTPMADETEIARLNAALDRSGASQREQLAVAARLLAAQRGRGQRGNGQGWM